VGRLSPATKFEPLAHMRQSGRERAAEPVIMFRIVHKTLQDEPPDAYRDQTVEIALGPRDAFKNGNVGTLVRRVPTQNVVCAVPPSQAKEKPPKAPKEPRVKELMQMALEWQRLLDSGEVATRLELARREGLTSGRITQIMYLLKLAPEIQEHLLNLPKSAHRSAITDRALWPITQIDDHREQLEAFQKLA